MSNIGNILGFINQFGVSSFNSNESLDVGRIYPVQIHKNYLLNSFNKDNIEFNKIFIDSDYLELDPITGKKYEELVICIYSLFLDYYDYLYEDINNKEYIHTIIPIGLINVCNPINLCFLGNIENNDFIFTQDQIFPFELNEHNKYIVINIDKSEDELSIDNTFSTITIIDDLNQSFKTYIRIVDENKRWSDWLEWKNNISININIVKVLEAVKNMKTFFEQKFLPTNEYESINILFKILYNDSMFYNNYECEYKWKINLFKINQEFSLSSYLIFLKSFLHNNIHTPKEDKLSCTYISQWQIIKTDVI